MAIESLTDRIFSSQSDVWSYGILLWEIFSLGKIPYPGRKFLTQHFNFPYLSSLYFSGMENGWALLRELQKGHRMEKPEYAPNFIGEMMANCWLNEPNDRPTFFQMADVIAREIEAVVGIDYLNLNAAENAEDRVIR